MNTIHRLDPLTLPLDGGAALIEASAGTGKTFTLAALYLRLVLGHGCTPLQPPEILVVTFTNAATRELRDRIRARLSAAARSFRHPEDKDIDPYLGQLIAEYDGEESRQQAAYRLDQAAQWMDEAAIYTIHGWSQRMLLQHAFASGSLFEQTLSEDESEALAECVRDYWRTFCYPLSLAAVRALRSLAATPDEFAEKLKPLLANLDAQLQRAEEPLPAAVAPTDFADRLSGWQQRTDELEQFARGLWKKQYSELYEQLMAACEQKQLNGRSYSLAKLPEQLQAMLGWSEGQQELKPKELGRFAQSQLDAKTNKGKSAPQHEAFAALDQLLEQYEAAPDLTPVLIHACGWVSDRLEHFKQRQAELGFDDLLTRLDSALEADSNSPLAQQIRSQYPVALIDEFQDTDPIQYRAFQTIYRPAIEGESGCSLLLIGDPKQAIYAFRGADIHTYLRAREDLQNAIYTLDTNYRSSGELVSAVNAIFAQGENRAEGAFLFAEDGHNPLPFVEVNANGTRDHLVIDNAVGKAMTGWWPEGEETLRKDDYRRQMALSCANKIAELLNQSAAGRTGFDDGSGQRRPLRAADIAVLVRTGTEARWVRDALQSANISSVYLSDRESVYRTQEALDLWRWLHACADPQQPGLIQAALATPTLALGFAQLDRLRHDEQAWEMQVEQFRELKLHWHRHGVLAMLRLFLERYDLSARLLNSVDGERRLTNLLHLAELLQRDSRQLDGEQALVRHLGDKISAADNNDEQILRLESDADRVQVITIHKSKGLEYPLVFLPFIADCRPVDGKSALLKYHRDGQTIIELDSSVKEAQLQADRERLQEDLRLLYVALTRPVYACWLGLAPLKGLEKSAIGTLLGTAPHTLLKQLGLAVDNPDCERQLSYQQRDQGVELSPAREVTRELDPDHWWIASYSALQLSAQTSVEIESEPVTPVDIETAQQATALETLPEGGVGSTELVPEDALEAIHRFAKGPAAGTFLHGILEWAASEGFAQVAADRARRIEYLAPRCQRRGWQAWMEVLDQWLLRLITTPLPSVGKSLADCETYQAEMEFWFEVHDLNTPELDRQVQAQLLAGCARPGLEFTHLNGMLKGFIDLLFEIDGRFWVLDYKSNWLGDSSAAYSVDAMREAVLHKRYDLQYLLYILALHRLLKARLPAYREDPASGYEHYVGGAVYLFLRGIEEPEQKGAFIDKPPVELILALDARFAREESAELMSEQMESIDE